MLTAEIMSTIKQLEIHTKRLVRGTLMGETRSTLKGVGFDFDQIREYQLGDDVRSIDWNSSARVNKVLVKQYCEERSRTLMLLVDVSASSFYGSRDAVKYHLFAQVASVLALVASYGKDSVSLLLFSDEVEKFIPPSKGSAHVHMIMRTLFSYKPARKKTNISKALEYVARLKRKDMLVFLISDAIDTGFDKNMKLVARKNDLIVIRAEDERERELPSVGFIAMQDIETGQEVTIDLRSKHLAMHNSVLKNRLHVQQSEYKKYGIDWIYLNQRQQYITTLVQFFRRRVTR